MKLTTLLGERPDRFSQIREWSPGAVQAHLKGNFIAFAAQLHHRLLRLVRWADKTQWPARGQLHDLGLSLRAMQTEGFSSLDRFTPLLFMFDPMRFGAESYRHFIASPDPTGLIQDILSGQALND